MDSTTANSTPQECATGAFLTLENISKEFVSPTQKVDALQSINLEVKEGEFAVFFGPSGCGKSTLLNLIAGFEKPTAGEILLAGEPVAKPGPDRLMMFQEHALFPWLNVIDNVMYGLKRHGKFRFKPRLRAQKARELLRMVHLEEF